MKIINAGVTAPKGFKCAGLRAGVKPGKTNKDMAMIVSEVPAKIAGTFTKNIVKAAPVLWGKKIVEEQEAVRAVVINTGIANACTGAQGYENVVTEAKEVAKLLDIKPEEVVVGSTGVIGQQLPMDVIKEGIKKLVPELKADRQSEEDASWAILTTDTKPKEAAVEVEIDGKTVTIAGMCKGSGMIHPNMGTMLGFITTDAAIDKALLLELQGNSLKIHSIWYQLMEIHLQMIQFLYLQMEWQKIKKLQKKMQTMKHSEKDYYMLTSLLQNRSQGMEKDVHVYLKFMQLVQTPKKMRRS